VRKFTKKAMAYIEKWVLTEMFNIIWMDSTFIVTMQFVNRHDP
jgi:hypothetical protein